MPAVDIFGRPQGREQTVGWAAEEEKDATAPWNWW
jgi:hypothetical protein